MMKDRTKQEIRIITKIVRELSLFFLMHGHRQVSLETKLDEDVTYFTIRVDSLRDDVLKTIQEKLSRERELEVETYGWELIGDMDDKSELEIVGLLIDDVHVNQKPKETVITLSRTSKYKTK